MLLYVLVVLRISFVFPFSLCPSPSSSSLFYIPSPFLPLPSLSLTVPLAWCLQEGNQLHGFSLIFFPLLLSVIQPSLITIFTTLLPLLSRISFFPSQMYLFPSRITVYVLVLVSFRRPRPRRDNHRRPTTIVLPGVVMFS